LKLGIRVVDLLEEKQKYLTCEQIKGESPDGGAVVDIRGEGGEKRRK